MTIAEVVGQALGLADVRSIDAIEPSFAAPWARGSGLGWVAIGCVGCLLLGMAFYARFQRGGGRKARIGLGMVRGVLLAILLLVLAEPILSLTITSRPKPVLWLLFDGTESMAIEDDPPGGDAGQSGKGRNTEPSSSERKRSRIAAVAELFSRSPNPWLDQLQEKFRLRAFLFERGDGARALDAAIPGSDQLDGKKLAEQLTAQGPVTAVGRAIEDLQERQPTTHLAGVVLFSDFAQNAGVAAVGNPAAPVERLARPVHTVGVGPTAAADVELDLHAPLVMKKGENETVLATVRQSGFEGRPATIRMTAQRLGEQGEAVGGADNVDERTIALGGGTLTESFTFTPTESGRYRFAATIEPLAGESVDANNRAERDATVRDDFLRLLYVENEPSWEWRFIKEVFHRDRLVGMRGFRTYLRSADPKVRQSNELFLPTLTPRRSEFFANDVIFLGDVKAEHLTPRFCEMAVEFVDKFGGGLVVIAGPRYGPGELAKTPLAALLPVVVDPQGRRRDAGEFALVRTREAEQVDFMQLGGVEGADNEKGWANLGRIPWYQPVLRKDPRATVLAEHPTDTTADGKTRQPLIAIRSFGRGQVVYIGFNETWRLRRNYGELYYRQFWGQLIHRLGLSHAIGAQKRFVVRTDREQYQADERARVTVEAFDMNFEPLTADKVTGGQITGEVVAPGRESSGRRRQPITLSLLREGVFEATVPLLSAGEYQVRVKDPLTEEWAEVTVQVSGATVERRSPLRNGTLEAAIAAASGGKSYDLASVERLPGDLSAVEKTETRVRVLPLASTWLTFGVVVALMLGEWGFRKWNHLP